MKNNKPSQQGDVGSQPSLATGNNNCSSVCHVCTEGISPHATAVHCVQCAKLCHLSCLVTAHKQKTGTPLRNSIEWLAEFVEQFRFQYYCDTCESVSKQTYKSIKDDDDAIKKLRFSMVDVTHRIDEIQSNLSHKLQHLIDASTSSKDLITSTIGIVTTADKPTSYAAVATKGISDAVKSAFTEVIAWQKSNDRDKSAIAVFGLLETNHDLKDAYGILRKLGCTATIISHLRIGKGTEQGTKGTKQARPLRIELLTADKCDQLVASFQRQRKFVNVSISPWILPSEMEKIRKLRQRCQDLNSKSASSDKPYVVISGRLMVRGQDDKLNRVIDADAPQNSSCSPTILFSADVSPAKSLNDYSNKPDSSSFSGLSKSPPQCASQANHGVQQSKNA